MEFITLGIGTPGDIPTFLLVGLSPTGFIETGPEAVGLTATGALPTASVTAVPSLPSAALTAHY